MNVRYLGTRMNKRQVRGGVTGNRYSYSSGQPLFTIRPEDRAQFRGDMEDGVPKFDVDVDGTLRATPITDAVTGSMTAEEVANLTIPAIQLHLNAFPMSRADLEDIMAAEELNQNRVGARRLIQGWINAGD